MPEMGLEKLEARLFSLRQDLNDTGIADIRRYLDSRYALDIQELNRNYLLLDKMIVLSSDINRSIHMYFSVLKQGIDLHGSFKKLLNEYTLVREK